MEDILLDEENNQPKGEVPYAALLPFVCTLLMINLVMGASKLTKGAEFSIVLLVYLVVVPIISSAVGLLIGIRPYRGLRFGQRWMRGSLIANIIIQSILFLFVIMV